MVLRDGDIEGLVSGVPVARRGDVLLGECFWASPMLNIMKLQGGLFFFVPVGEDAERRQDGGTFPDYFRAPVGASWKTRLIDRFPEIGKPWNKAKNDRTRLSSEVRMMIVLIAVKSCRTPRRGRQHRRARKRGTSPSARVHRGRAAQTRHRRLGDVMDTPQNGVQRRRDGMRRPAIAAIRPGGSFHRGRHGRPTIRAGLHVILPATVSPESRIAVASHPRQSRATSTLKEEHACLDPVWAPSL